VDIDCLAATIAAPSALSALAPGDLVAERYRVEAEIGRGAMGVVYRVEHVFMRKRFALKVMDGVWAKMPGALARFEREAITAGAIADPHIANATDFGRLSDGSCFLVLEYVDGVTLRSVLGRGALKPRRALRIARGIVSAVEAAHDAGIVHRDLKPENVMLLSHDDNPDYVKVLDFGIAAFDASAESHGSSDALTVKGAVLGTPLYMAPEQVIGERVDTRSDLYAVGVILFEMLTGDVPFPGTPISVLHQHVVQESPALSSSVLAAVGENVAQILRRLLAKEPGARFATARELGAALDECLAGTKSAGPAPAVRAEVLAALSSLRAWRSAFLGKLHARRARRRVQYAFAWPRRIDNRFRAWRRRRHGHATLAVIEALPKRVRKWLGRARTGVAIRNLALVLAAAMVLLLLASAWQLGRATGATALSTHAKSSTSLSSESAHSRATHNPGPHTSSHHPPGATSSSRRP
jgi:hypothetical protein